MTQLSRKGFSQDSFLGKSHQDASLRTENICTQACAACLDSVLGTKDGILCQVADLVCVVINVDFSLNVVKESEHFEMLSAAIGASTDITNIEKTIQTKVRFSQ